MGNYESGRSHPKEEVMYRLFGALGCEPNELFEDYFDAGESAGRLHLKKYLALDAHGRELVDMCTDIEYRRCVSDDEDMLLIAARKGGVPHKVHMKKRGTRSILDMPDYKG